MDVFIKEKKKIEAFSNYKGLGKIYNVSGTRKKERGEERMSKKTE